MTPFLHLTEQDLIESLALRVSILALAQVAAGWWPSEKLRTVRRRIRRLEAVRLAELHVINAHPMLPVGRPVYAWQPGDDDPDAECVSFSIQKRWALAAIPLEVCVASPLASNMLGSTARSLPQREHRDHDLRLASVYVHYRQHHPRLAQQWIGEHARPKAGYRIKDPDAFLIDDQGRVVRVIESAGRYGPEQVQSFHEHCVENRLSYELW